MQAELAPFLGTWTLMMAAMMLPSAAPMVLLHHAGTRGEAALGRVARSAVFVLGYLVVWAAIGIAVWLGGLVAEALLPMDARPYAVALVLAAAGAYQLTPLKHACLRACRTPADFLVTHWYGGRLGTLRLGLAHGVYCVGCCVALMAVFVGAGAMGLAWAVAIAAIVFAEKLFPGGILVARLTGGLLIVAAAAVALRPELVDLLGGM